LQQLLLTVLTVLKGSLLVTAPAQLCWQQQWRLRVPRMCGVP
jgi:hypothetical protein